MVCSMTYWLLCSMIWHILLVPCILTYPTCSWMCSPKHSTIWKKYPTILHTTPFNKITLLLKHWCPRSLRWTLTFTKKYSLAFNLARKYDSTCKTVSLVKLFHFIYYQWRIQGRDLTLPPPPIVGDHFSGPHLNLTPQVPGSVQQVRSRSTTDYYRKVTVQLLPQR